jgi:hypothetical protein
MSSNFASCCLDVGEETKIAQVSLTSTKVFYRLYLPFLLPKISWKKGYKLRHSNFICSNAIFDYEAISSNTKRMLFMAQITGYMDQT